jgi:hypothetical protein
MLKKMMVLLTPEEMEYIEKRSKEEKMSRSKYVIKLIMDKK